MNHPRHHTIKKQPSNVDDKQFLDPVPTSRPRRRGRRAAEVYELGADIAALQRRERWITAAAAAAAASPRAASATRS